MTLHVRDMPSARDATLRFSGAPGTNLNCSSRARLPPVFSMDTPSVVPEHDADEDHDGGGGQHQKHRITDVGMSNQIHHIWRQRQPQQHEYHRPDDPPLSCRVCRVLLLSGVGPPPPGLLASGHCRASIRPHLFAMPGCFHDDRRIDCQLSQDSPGRWSLRNGEPSRRRLPARPTVTLCSSADHSSRRAYDCGATRPQSHPVRSVLMTIGMFVIVVMLDLAGVRLAFNRQNELRGRAFLV